MCWLGLRVGWLGTEGVLSELPLTACGCDRSWNGESQAELLDGISDSNETIEQNQQIMWNLGAHVVGLVNPVHSEALQQ
jgi:hypothetical protein